MPSLNDIINRSEDELQRLTLQHQQEIALAQLIPVRFSQNIDAFQKYIPSIAEQFSSYKPSADFEIFCTENGIANLRWQESGHILYGEDPFDECLQQIEATLASGGLIKFGIERQWDPFQQQHFLYTNALQNVIAEFSKQNTASTETLPHDIPLMLMFGLGLGYQLGYLYERKNIANLFVFEPNLDLFYASLFCFDWAPLLDYIAENKLGIHIFLGQDEHVIMQDLKDAVNKKGAFLSSQVFGMSHYQSAVLSSLQAQIAKEFYSLAMGWGFFDDSLFGLANGVDNILAGARFLSLKNRLPTPLKKTPVFVIANGPSLDADIEFIRAHQHQAILIACGTAISSLYRAGITPDIYIAVERVNMVAAHLAQMNASDYLQDILMIAPDVIHADTKRMFKRYVLGIKADEPLYVLLCNHFDWAAELQCLSCINPLVGNLGISLPLHLGFERVYLFGLDNGFKSAEHHHSRLSGYYDEKGNPIAAYKDMALALADNIRPANFGGEVQTNQLFSASVMMAEFLVQHCPDANIYNCSDGALIKGCEPLKSRDIVDLPPMLDKKVLVDYIYNDMAISVDTSRDAIEPLLDVDLFARVMELMKQDWAADFASRAMLVEAMQRSMEYINVIRESRQSHIHNILFGSLNGMFTLYLAIAYFNDDETLCMACVNEHRHLFVEFLDRMGMIYPHALDYIQGRHIAAVPGLAYQLS